MDAAKKKTTNILAFIASLPRINHFFTCCTPRSILGKISSLANYLELSKKIITLMKMFEIFFKFKSRRVLRVTLILSMMGLVCLIMTIIFYLMTTSNFSMHLLLDKCMNENFK